MKQYHLQDLKILIAEDDGNSAKLVVDFLTAKGVKYIQHAIDGITAMAMADRELFDVAIVDLRLPGENGFMVTEHIRRFRNPTQTAIIVVSAFFDKQNKLRALESGANAFFGKPLDLKELLMMIGNFSEQKLAGDHRVRDALDCFSRLGRRKLGLQEQAAALRRYCMELAEIEGIEKTLLSQLLDAADLCDLCLPYESLPDEPHAQLAAGLLQSLGMPPTIVELVRWHDSFDMNLQTVTPEVRVLLPLLHRAVQRSRQAQ